MSISGSWKADFTKFILDKTKPINIPTTFGIYIDLFHKRFTAPFSSALAIDL